MFIFRYVCVWILSELHILLFSVYVILFVFVLLICMLMFTWYTFCCCALQYTYLSCIQTLKQNKKKRYTYNDTVRFEIFLNLFGHNSAYTMFSKKKVVEFIVFFNSCVMLDCLTKRLKYHEYCYLCSWFNGHSWLALLFQSLIVSSHMI